MYIIITASPNTDGLTAACGGAAHAGIAAAGGSAEIIDISALKLEACRICGDGWGNCRSESKCVIGDCFDGIQKKIRDAQGVFLVTPVYFCQPSERMKYFCDRFRRCESSRESRDGASWAKGKQISLVAAAGGSGHGMPTCLDELEVWCRHIRTLPQEQIGITNYNREHMLKVIEDAGARMVRGEYFKGR